MLCFSRKIAVILQRKHSILLYVWPFIAENMLYNMFLLARKKKNLYLCSVFFMVLDFKVKKRETL